jgi:1-acyl-sn-glycerol-3-phosphate acyltransferase
VIFPEETRTREGDLLPFKRGAAHLAVKAGLPLLPIGIAGTFRILPRGSREIQPGPVVVSVGEPIDVSGRTLRDRDALTEEIRDAIAALREEARASLTSG